MILMRGRRGFTLVELLVVITIITLLLGFLLPGLMKAKQASLAIRCGSSLKQWGIGLSSYANDHQGDFPPAWGPIFAGIYPYTYRVHTASDDYVPGTSASAVISLEMMGPYLQGVPANLSVAPTPPQKPMDGVWRCPAAFNDLDTVNESQWTSYGWVYGDYSYFGRSDLWTTANGFRADVMTNPEDIIQNDPRADRLWMSDVCFKWASGNSSWYFNHYAANMASAFHGNTGDLYLGPPNLSGLNQLFGDGHVFWKGSAMFGPVLMDSGNPGVGSRFIRGGGTDATFY